MSEQFSGKEKNKKLHSGCCEEWFPLFLVVAVFVFCPDLLYLFMSVATTGIGGGVISLVVLGIVGRKMQVLSWQGGRPFSDGVDSTPDLYLFNPGDGSGWHIRAFMPTVESFSLLATPISWLLKQAKRQTGIVLSDGSVSFPMLPVSWLSSPGRAGSQIDIPPGYVIPWHIVVALQKRRDGILEKRSCPNVISTEYEKNFILFTDEIFKRGGPFVLEVKPVEGSIDKLSLLEDKVNRQEDKVNRQEYLQKEQMQIMLRDFMKIFGETKDLMEMSVKLDKWEASRPVALGKLSKRVVALEKRKG